MVKQLLDHGSATHASLGVSLTQSAAGVRIAAVEQGSAAADAGLRKGDVIVSVDGAPAGSVDAVIAAVQAQAPGTG